MREKKLLHVQEMAEILGVHPMTIRRMVERGKLPTVRIPGLARILFDPEDIERLIEASKVMAGSGN